MGHNVHQLLTPAPDTAAHRPEPSQPSLQYRDAMPQDVGREARGFALAAAVGCRPARPQPRPGCSLGVSQRRQNPHWPGRFAAVARSYGRMAGTEDAGGDVRGRSAAGRRRPSDRGRRGGRHRGRQNRLVCAGCGGAKVRRLASGCRTCSQKTMWLVWLLRGTVCYDLRWRTGGHGIGASATWGEAAVASVVVLTGSSGNRGC